MKEACFGAEAHPQYREFIKAFEDNWTDLYIEHGGFYTNKLHVIIEHVPQAIERPGSGLLGNSEQVVEATHAKFDVYWQRYKVVNMESESHGERLLNCVIDFVASNI